jgi:tetratricopeptide (TPR) repeat protein
MKRLKIFSCLLVLLFLLVVPAVAETPVSAGVQAGDLEDDSKVESIINQVKEYREAGNFEEALKQLNIALEKYPQKEYKEKLQVECAKLHFVWAESLKKKYDYVNAIKHYELAYAIDKNYRSKCAALNLNNIGFLYKALGQKQKALEFFQEALPIIQEVGNCAGEAAILNNIGEIYYGFGQKQKALKFFQEALPIAQALGNRAYEAVTLVNIGFVYNALGQKQKALEYFEKALPIAQEVGNRAYEAATLNNIGFLYKALGQNQKALEFYQEHPSVSG